MYPLLGADPLSNNFGKGESKKQKKNRKLRLMIKVSTTVNIPFYYDFFRWEFEYNTIQSTIQKIATTEKHLRKSSLLKRLLFGWVNFSYNWRLKFRRFF